MIGVDESLPWFTGGFLEVHGQPRFTSCQECPSCRTLATHWLSPPKPGPTPEQFLEWATRSEEFLKNPGLAVMAWGGCVVRRIGGFPQPEDLIDESMFEVMRVCVECKHRWGNV